MTTPDSTGYAPETLEGWYSLHQIFRAAPSSDLSSARNEMSETLRCDPSTGWSACFRLIGSSSDWMLIHFRDTLDGIGEAQARVASADFLAGAELTYSFLSVTEAGLYHLTAELVRDAMARGGKAGDKAYEKAFAERAGAERESPQVRKRLYPELPPAMPYVCFYPMNKRRDAGQNWYTLSLEERSRLMLGHGMVGRRYAGKVVQVISGAIGFDAWEWGVTLFAADPLEFKKLVSEMRFDEASAKYAEFGDFYVGKIVVTADSTIVADSH